MKEGLIEKIRSKAYWRVNFKPLSLPAQDLPLPECNQLVEKSRVELRGWDYPHISRRNDDSSGYAPVGQYYEHWVDWEQHIEFWRMYRTSQFLHYRALWEDWTVWTNAHRGPPPKSGAVSVIGTIWLFTEIFEFLFRLHRNGVYSSGVDVNIRLEHAQGRHLWIGEFDRMPFSYDRKTQAEAVEIKFRAEPEILTSEDHNVFLPKIIEFFENFDWSPNEELVKSDRQRLLTRTF